MSHLPARRIIQIYPGTRGLAEIDQFLLPGLPLSEQPDEAPQYLGARYRQGRCSKPDSLTEFADERDSPCTVKLFFRSINMVIQTSPSGCNGFFV